MNDLVRHYLKAPDGSGLRFHVEQRLYFYGKLEDTSIQFYITDTLKGPKYSLSTLSIYRLWWMYPDIDNTCLCKDCENLNELIKAIRNNRNKLDKPFRKIRARYALQAFQKAYNEKLIKRTREKTCYF